MIRRGALDAVIVGGGVVGAACALALARAGLDVAVVEGVQPEPWRRGRPDLRVYAFAPDNAGLLARLDVWDAVRDAGAHPYRRMRVWDAAGGGELRFDADAFGRRELGWIVEHGLLVDRLWAALPGAGVRVHCPARVDAMDQDDAGVRVRLDDGVSLQARIAIAADGAESSLRKLAGITVDRHDYPQRGLVGYVQSRLPHEDTAWQRFLPGGPLAVLPCADGSSSIVWTLDEASSAGVLALDDAAFGHALTRAFDGRLGEMRPLSRRVAFRLRRQLARDYVAGRVLVIGDAAHVVHPLAGQGVNLGLRDVAALVDCLGRANGGQDGWTPSRLARWARQRRSENAMAAHAFDRINRLYGGEGVLASLVRGPLLGIAGRTPGIPQLLWRRACGL